MTKKNPQLAILVDEVYFIPNLSQGPSTPATPSSTVSQQKRANHWGNRAGPSTPMKRPREVTPIAKIPHPDAPDCQDDDDHPAYMDSVLSSGLSRKIDDDDQNDIPVIPSTPSTAHVEETLSPSPETPTRRSKRMRTTS
jgi:hypothetical protein